MVSAKTGFNVHESIV